MTLSLPDICSALETEEKDQARYRIEKRYKAWFEKYAAPKFGTFDANDCWALRGGVVHNAILSKHPKNVRGRLLLMPPNSSGMVVDEMVVQDTGEPPQDALQIFIPAFCDRVAAAVREWWEANKNNPIVQKNLPDLVRFRPQGLAPFMVGFPVIA